MKWTSLKTLDFYISHYIQNVSLTTYPGEIACLRNLSELNCYSNLYSEFFRKLSQIIKYMYTLRWHFKGVMCYLTNMISTLPNLSNILNTLIKLEINVGFYPSSYTFNIIFDDFKDL